MIRPTAVILFGLTAAAVAAAQSSEACVARVVFGTSTTDAGDGGPAVQAQFWTPLGVVRDPAGNLYVADYGNNKIRVVRTDGTIQTVAGTGVPGGGGDGGPALGAQLYKPVNVAVDAGGVLYIVEQAANRIRRVSPDGTIETVAGTGDAGFSGDGGPATRAKLKSPRAVVPDGKGGIYIADSGNARVRRVSREGKITTFAGSGRKTSSQTSDGAPAITGYVYPGGLALGPDGTLYIVGDNAIKTVTPDGLLHTIAGGKEYGGNAPAEGVAASTARIYVQDDIALAANGDVYFATSSSPLAIWRIDSNGILHYVMDTSGENGMILSPDGTVIRSNPTSQEILRSSAKSTTPGRGRNTSVIAGATPRSTAGDGRPGASARIFNPEALAADAAGNVYIADSWGGRVRKLDANGTAGTVASELYYPAGVAAGPAGEIYYTEPYAYRVRKAGADGTSVTVAGTGLYPMPYRRGFDSRDGAKATDAGLSPDAIAVDAGGNLFILDTLSGVMWRVGPDGIIHFVTGLAPVTGGRRSMAATPNGGVYYTDYSDGSRQSINRITPDFKTEVVSSFPDWFNQFQGLAMDKSGNAYVSTFMDGRLYRVTPDGKISALITEATPGPNAFTALAVDGAGNLYAAETTQARIFQIPSAGSCAALEPPVITAGGIVNNASYANPGQVAPGEIVAIFGLHVGPEQGAPVELDAGGNIRTSAGGTQVWFDGVPAPVLYASSLQTIAIVPYTVNELGQAGYSHLKVSVNGLVSNTVQLTVSNSRLGIFTQNAAGSGPGAILNADYSLNTVLNPAKKGSFVMVYGTGLGQVDPGVEDGIITGVPFSTHTNQVRARIGGVDAQVLYAGTAPGLVAGATQVNVAVPANAPSGSQSITLQPAEGDGASQPNVTVWIE